MKEGKTDPPAASFEWIGYWFMMRLMHFGFRQKKLDKMVAAVTPFSSVATTTPNVKQARSAYGLLNHATNVIRLGKAYAYVVQKRVVALDTQSKRRTAPCCCHPTHPIPDLMGDNTNQLVYILSKLILFDIASVSFPVVLHWNERGKLAGR
eukprot:COSAG01_NODE_1000_length_12213_cov_20.853063_12_plen_151_part_00